MKPFPTSPMEQHDLLIAALCADWREHGIIKLDTPRAKAVLEIAKQLNKQSERDGA